MVSKLMIPGAFDHQYMNCKMEWRWEKCERGLLVERKVNPNRLEEIQQLWEKRKGDCSRRRSRRDHAPTRRRRRESFSELLDRTLLLLDRNTTFWGGGLVVKDEESGSELNSEPLVAQGSSNLQQWGTHQVTQIPSEIATEKKDMEAEDNGREGDISISKNFFTVPEIEKQLEGELKATKEFSKKEDVNLQAELVEAIKVEGDGGNVTDLSEMKMEKEDDRHHGGGSNRNHDSCCVGGSGLNNSGGGRCKGGGRGSGVMTMIGGGHLQPLESLELLDRDVSVEREGTSPAFHLSPPNPPDRDEPVEEGGTLPNFLLQPPEPPDLSVCLEVDGSFDAAEGGSFIAAVVKMSAKTFIACERGKGARAAEEKVGQNLGRLNQAQRVEIQMADERLMKIRGSAEYQLGYFLNLMGQSQQGVESTLELGGEEIAEYWFGPKLTCTQPIRIDCIAAVFAKPNGSKGTKIEGQPKEGNFEPGTGAELLETRLCFGRTKENLFFPSSVFFKLEEAWRRIRFLESTEYTPHLGNRREESGTMRYLHFILTASDLEGCYHNLEAFHHEQDIIQRTEKLRPCAEALYMNSVISLLSETMNSCPTSVREITPAFLLKNAAYGAAAYVHHELPNYRSFKNWFNGALSIEPSHEHPNLHIIHRKVAVISGQWISDIKDDTERPVYCALIRLLQGKDLSVRLAACQSLCLHIEDANFSEMEFVDLLPICWNSCFILFEEVQKNHIPKSFNFGGNVVILNINPITGTKLYSAGCFSFQQYSAPCVVLLCQGHVNDLTKTTNILVDKICQVLLGAAKVPETWPVCFKQWDPGESSHISWSLYFQQWDPGGRLYAGCFLYPHLEDKVCLQKGCIDRDLGPRPNRTRPEITKTHGSMSHLILTCLTNCCVGRKEGG